MTQEEKATIATNLTRQNPIANRVIETMEPIARPHPRRRDFDILSGKEFPESSVPGAGWGGRPAPVDPEQAPRKLSGNRGPLDGGKVVGGATATRK